MNIQILKIGINGKYYDKKEQCRAYTYKNQPNGVEAYRIGKAVDKAKNDTHGDHIDLGLNLLQQLECLGFGVFEIKRDAIVNCDDSLEN